MQEKLDEREGETFQTFKPSHWVFISQSACRSYIWFYLVPTEAELSRRNSEDNVENIPLSKKSVVILKKELAQKTEALNKALKRENELKVSQL